MKRAAIALFLLACSKKPLAAPDAGPVAVVDAAPPPVAVIDAGPPPENFRVVHCTSKDRLYRVDLDLVDAETQPRRAHVHDLTIDANPEDEYVQQLFQDKGTAFPPASELTCSKAPTDPSFVGCDVAGTDDYGYIAKCRLKPDGKRTVELLKNGIASKHLADLTCDG